MPALQRKGRASINVVNVRPKAMHTLYHSLERIIEEAPFELAGQCGHFGLSSLV